MEVAHVVAGDTVEVTQGDRTVQVRLANVDAPAPGGTGDDVECLGDESAAALQELLPEGTEVRLEPALDPDSEADQAVAAVFVGDVLVNAEIVRQGLGHALADDAASATDVASAEEEAIAAGAGLFGTDDSCTVPAQLAAFEDASESATVAAAALAAGVGLDEVDRRSTAVDTAAASGAALTALLSGDPTAYPLSRYPATMIANMRGRVEQSSSTLVSTAATVQQLRTAEEQRIEAERVAAEEAARVAAEAEAARVAQEAADAEAARVAAEKAAAKAAKPAPVAPAAPPVSAGTATSYANCTAVRAAGAAPIYAGQPGYSRKLDRDGDGIGCE